MKQINSNDYLVVVHDRIDVVLCSFLYFLFVLFIFAELFFVASYVSDSVDYWWFVVFVVIGIVFTVVKIRYRVVIQDGKIKGIPVQDFDGYMYGFWNKLCLVYKGKVVVRVNMHDDGYAEFERYIRKHLKEI